MTNKETLRYYIDYLETMQAVTEKVAAEHRKVMQDIEKAMRELKAREEYLRRELSSREGKLPTAKT